MGLGVAALILLAWLVWGKGALNGIGDALKPPAAKIKNTDLGSWPGEVRERLGEPESRSKEGARSCWSYRSKEGKNYRLCFGPRDRLRTIEPVPDGQ